MAGAARVSDSPLTQPEAEVVRSLAAGKCNKEVTATLGVSSSTIESHRSHIMHEMDFASFSDVIRYAIRKHPVEA